jgi:hypothetical protein
MMELENKRIFIVEFVQFSVYNANIIMTSAVRIQKQMFLYIHIQMIPITISAAELEKTARTTK